MGRKILTIALLLAAIVLALYFVLSSRKEVQRNAQMPHLKSGVKAVFRVSPKQISYLRNKEDAVEEINSTWLFLIKDSILPKPAHFLVGYYDENCSQNQKMIYASYDNATQANEVGRLLEEAYPFKKIGDHGSHISVFKLEQEENNFFVSIIRQQLLLTSNIDLLTEAVDELKNDEILQDSIYKGIIPQMDLGQSNLVLSADVVKKYIPVQTSCNQIFWRDEPYLIIDIQDFGDQIVGSGVMNTSFHSSMVSDYIKVAPFQREDLLFRNKVTWKEHHVNEATFFDGEAGRGMLMKYDPNLLDENFKKTSFFDGYKIYQNNDLKNGLPVYMASDKKYLIGAATVDELKKAIYTFEKKQRLNLKTLASDSAHFFLYSEESLLLNKDIDEVFENHKPTEAWQLSFTQKEDGYWLVDWISNPIKKSLENKTSSPFISQVNWEQKVEVEITQGPYAIYNHQSDKFNFLYLNAEQNLICLNHKGKELWRKSIEGAVIGIPEQIDVYKNRKLQTLVTTNKAIYLIDRLGRDVESFPIKDSIVGPVLVTDYDKNRKYRIILPTSSGVKCFDALGKVVRGWNVFQSEKVVDKLKYLKVGSKDYLLACDVEGTNFLLNRKGNERAQTELNIGTSPGWGVINGAKIKEAQVVYINGNNVQITSYDGDEKFATPLLYKPDTLLGYNKNGKLSFLVTDYRNLHLVNDGGLVIYEAQNTSPYPIMITGSRHIIALVPSANGYFALWSSGKTDWVNAPASQGVCYSVSGNADILTFATKNSLFQISM